MEFVEFKDMQAGKWAIVQARLQQHKDKEYTDLSLYKEINSEKDDRSAPLFDSKAAAKKYIEDCILASLKTFLTEEGYKFYTDNNKFFVVRLENYKK